MCFVPRNDGNFNYVINKIVDSKKFKRAILVGLIMMCLSFQQFTRLSGIENVKAIHIVTLLGCGAGFGIFIFSLVLLIRNRNKN